MIRFFCGKQRGGKTKRVVIWLIEILRTTRYPIVTNLALELGPWVDGAGVARRGLLRVLQDRYGTDFDAKRRLTIIEDVKELRRFYSYRPRIPSNTWDNVEMLRLPEPADGKFRFDGDRYPGVVYMLDEVHMVFPGMNMNAPKEDRMSVEAVEYASQAGRCGDLVFAISQVPNNVDVKFRGQAQECHWLTNHVHLQLGPFRQPDRISYRVYSSTPPAAGEQWLARGLVRYRRDDIESCYNTSRGAAVQGTTAADIGRRAKGAPFWAIGLLIALIMFAAWGVYYGATASARAYFRMKGGKPSSGVVAAGGVSADAVRGIVVEMLRGWSSNAVLSVPMVSTNGGRVTVTGVVGSGGRVRLLLSDGRTVRTGDGHFESWNGPERWGIVDGQRVEMR